MRKQIVYSSAEGNKTKPISWISKNRNLKALTCSSSCVCLWCTGLRDGCVGGGGGYVTETVTAAYEGLTVSATGILTWV